MEGYRRKTPEEILDSISKLHRGNLKIYIGPVSGSGKTYHMLREGNALSEHGIDVVICAVSTLQRPETVEQIGSLERVPSIHWYKNQLEMKDLNLEALIERNPEVVLVDGLAHRNRPGARFLTRVEDIQWLLSHNISVITTVNVYELEEYAELAYEFTGIEVEHTVPASMLELADEVRLIDVTPETILNRLAEGHLKFTKDSGVYKRVDLGILREMALRLVAEDVGESLKEYREEMGLIGPLGTEERILVSTQYHWNGSIYVRRGQQIAKRLNGDLLVLTFRNFKKPLSKEAESFRRNILSLVEKVGGEFEEKSFFDRRSLSKAIVQYAEENQVTRIVMGHTKQPRWKEFWQGSIVNDLLKIVKNIDVFLVADRFVHEGERILSAKRSAENVQQRYRRLSEQEVAEKIGKMKRGTFKVYIGAAPGVGKTYTMLREGNDLVKKGIEVHIGLLETHNRPATKAQVGHLPMIPRQQIHYRDVWLEEMDLEAIMRHRPELVLIDELAHTNVPGSKNKKRYEDVLEILEAGISVIATMNVQHLESLNDAVEQITGIRVRETVPDRILQMADEVQLIDVSPEALQKRMLQGEIYEMSKVDQALANFFKTGNLIALRELALRELADDVDERLESLERRSSLRGPWRRQEVIFVCVNSTPHAERLIRRGFRMAYRLKATWYVNYVRIDKGPQDALNRRLETIQRLTESLGGQFRVYDSPSSKEIASVLSSKAAQVGATQLVIGQSKLSLYEELRKGSVVKQLIHRSRHIDVFIVADYESKTES